MTPLHGLTLAEDSFDGGPAALDYYGTSSLHRFTMCGTAIQNMTFAGFDVFMAYASRIAGNRFHGNDVAFALTGGRNVTLECNEVSGSLADGITLGSENSTLSKNSFFGNGGAHSVGGWGNDLRYNWWGDASGPSGDGPGSGEPLLRDPGMTAAFTPWLTSPPSLPANCSVAGPPGAPAHPASEPLEAHARAQASAPGVWLNFTAHADAGRWTLL